MINIALLGAGRIGKMHAEIINAHPKSRLQFVYDVNSDSAKQVSEENNSEAVNSAEEAINSEKVDAILTPSNPISAFKIR